MKKQTKEQDKKVFEEDIVCIEADLNDDLLSTAKIACYDANVVLQDKDGKNVPVNPKKFPDRAINIRLDINGTPVYIFFNSKLKAWDSSFKLNDTTNGALNPNQFEKFFNSQFYEKLIRKLKRIWPLSDPYHASLYEGVLDRGHVLGCKEPVEEALDDKNKSKYSASGRKYISFKDSGVDESSTKFFCWPNINKIYSWSTWKDWKKIRPLCRMRFKYKNNHEYGISLSVLGKDYKFRGFKAYDLTEEPPLQWLSKDETYKMMKLSIVDKFIKHCVQQMEKYLALKAEDIYAKINNPEKITINEIKDTQTKISNTLNYVIKKKQADSFKWKH